MGAIAYLPAMFLLPIGMVIGDISWAIQTGYFPDITNPFAVSAQ